MTDNTADTPAGPVLAADGRPLKASLNRALRAQKIRALLLIAPLLLFILITFILPIADMLFRSVENQIVRETLPRTVAAMEEWENHDEAPGEDVYAGLYIDLFEAAEFRRHTRVGSRLNYEMTGISSLFRQAGRGVGRFDTDIYTDQFTDLDAAWADYATWTGLMGDSAIRAALPETAAAFDTWVRITIEANEDDPAEENIEDFVYLSLYRDLAGSGYSGSNALLSAAAEAVGGFESISIRDQFEDLDEDWLNPELMETIWVYSPSYTPGYFLTAIDMQLSADGITSQPEDRQIYVTLFGRTLFMSLVIMGSCVLLGYPIAFLLANLPMRVSNILMILVLLPFWTSLLVRTSAWKVLLQQQGVINDILVWVGLVADDARLQLINNQTGTIIAMTHILLPFMILPLYSVMQTIPPSYVRAAKSLGATDWTAFWRVYFPQSIPGIGAGCILVFILAIGYYITPELVGGRTGTFISNRIAYHISSSLNWGLAAALGSILLGVVLILYWIYDRIVGIDNVKLG
ncbi:ABC transporter permease [Nioella sp.]|uniref:ABC transporter permease n=1 Tax=Nioella sp. TaxID=1912091 RepID=UPI003B516205